VRFARAGAHLAGVGPWRKPLAAGLECATRRDLAPVVRVSFWGLVALIMFGIVLIFVQIPVTGSGGRRPGWAPSASAG